jgi:hypothetical protein
MQLLELKYRCVKFSRQLIMVSSTSILTETNTKPVNVELTAEQQKKLFEEKKFVDSCGKLLKKLMLEYDITNINLAALAEMPEPYISRLRNGSLSQRNFIKIIRALPTAPRIDYLVKVFDLTEDDLKSFLTRQENQRR